ncbi:MAG: YwbE family protein [Bacteroidota bacterium]
MQGQNRSEVIVGIEVGIVLKQDQRSGNVTQGIVKDILTKVAFHPHGIKVRLTTGEIGRVKNIQ